MAGAHPGQAAHADRQSAGLAFLRSFLPSLILTAERRGEGDGADAPRLLAAYGAPRRHSRACSGIQRNKGNHLGHYCYTSATR